MNSHIFRISRDISTLLILAIVLSLMRVILFQDSSLLYLLWNIFLALLPFLVSSLLLYHAKKIQTQTQIQVRSTTALICGGIIWILLIPNAPYIVTDLIHLVHTKGVPMIYDTFLLFTAAWVGLLLFFYSFSHIEQIIRMKYSQKVTSLFLILLVVIISFGMYLGRFLRFNSWDIFANPSQLYGGIATALSANIGEAVTFIILSSVFLYVSYTAWKQSQNTLL